MKTPMQTIRERKKDLVAELMQLTPEISNSVSGFVKDTGVPVRWINFQFVDVTAIGGQPEYVLNGVEMSYLEEL